ncbi:MAG: hypothetical protein ACI8PB_005508, partial [Desulforhopalus sp.]
NSCPESSGMSVQIQMEWVSGMKWNHRPVSRGIGVQIALEYASMAGEKFDAVMKEMWPFIGTQIVTLFFITYIPETTLWLPRFFGFL